MEDVGLNEITFLGVLAASSHGWLVKEGCGYFSLMKIEYRIITKHEDYSCMVDMFQCAGFAERNIQSLYML